MIHTLSDLSKVFMPRAAFMQQQAPAGAPVEGTSFIMQFLVPLALVFVIFYFLLIRPASKKQKALQEMLKSLKNGDKIITTGGIYGVIAGITEEVVQLRVANGVKIDVARNAIAGLQKEE